MTSVAEGDEEKALGRGALEVVVPRLQLLLSELVKMPLVHLELVVKVQ
jgi:hypothetical protein